MERSHRLSTSLVGAVPEISHQCYAPHIHTDLIQVPCAAQPGHAQGPHRPSRSASRRLRRSDAEGCAQGSVRPATAFPRGQDASGNRAISGSIRKGTAHGSSDNVASASVLSPLPATAGKGCGWRRVNMRQLALYVRALLAQLVHLLVLDWVLVALLPSPECCHRDCRGSKWRVCSGSGLG